MAGIARAGQVKPESTKLGIARNIKICVAKSRVLHNALIHIPQVVTVTTKSKVYGMTIVHEPSIGMSFRGKTTIK